MFVGGGPPASSGPVGTVASANKSTEDRRNAVRTAKQEQAARAELALPPSVQEALGELVNAAKDGLLALSVGVGLGVLAEMMETEVEEVVGSKGKRNPDRAAVRHGHESGEVTLGGRRVGVQRPRARTVDGEHEVALG